MVIPHKKSRHNAGFFYVWKFLISGSGRPCITDNYLIIKDSRSVDKIIHIIDKRTFIHVNSFAYKGLGPGEIANIGHIAFNKKERLLYVSDHGKNCIFSYPLDSILVNPDYLPGVKMKMNASQFPDEYHYVNDTLSIGVIIEPIGNNNFKPIVGKWNMNTGEITLMKYEHPDIEKKRFICGVSIENGIYVEGHTNRDLMTICDLDGNLKWNIYGEDWDGADTRGKSYYRDIEFCGDKIIALYSGGEDYSRETGERLISGTLLVFNLNGDYQKTLETGLRITETCYDSENNRLILTCDDEIQFGYLDLDGLI